MHFLEFSKKEKWLTSIQKISVTKVQKSKIWDDRFVGFLLAIVVVYFDFSVGAVFMEKFISQNCQFVQKIQKRAILYGKIFIIDTSYVFFLWVHVVAFSVGYAVVYSTFSREPMKEVLWQDCLQHPIIIFVRFKATADRFKAIRAVQSNLLSTQNLESRHFHFYHLKCLGSCIDRLLCQSHLLYFKFSKKSPTGVPMMKKSWCLIS